MLWSLGYGLWWQTDERIVSKIVVFKHLARIACTVKYINAAVFFSAKIESVLDSHLTGLDILFRCNKFFIRFSLAFVFGLQTLWLLNFTKIYRIKGLKPRNKTKQNHMNNLIWQKICLVYLDGSHLYQSSRLESPLNLCFW